MIEIRMDIGKCDKCNLKKAQVLTVKKGLFVTDIKLICYDCLNIIKKKVNA